MGPKFTVLLVTAVLLGGTHGDSLGETASARHSHINGKVERVLDGDSLLIRPDDGSRTIEVRLYGVDAPEGPIGGPIGGPSGDADQHGQPFADEARAFTASLALGKDATIRVKGLDSHSRTVGEAFVDGRSLGRELVRAGLAWWNSRYEPDDLDIKRLEEAARRDGTGLWKDASPEPPWEYRRRAPRRTR
jgi:endonuclease YncB( thermonuclease family)